MGKKAKNLHGLNARTFPQSVRWKVDQDYLGKLTPEEKEWLSRFNDCFIGADFRGDDEKTWTPEERRVVYRAKNAAGRDVFTSGLVDVGRHIPERKTDFSDENPETPAYLNSKQYKEALSEFREEIDEKKKRKKAK